MKQSTCRYFQRDIAPLRRWKSTRREATSGGLASCVLIDSASAGHRDAVRVVGVDDVRLELLEQARQAPRRAEIHLRLRRQRNEVEPLLRPLPQLAPRMRHEHRPMPERPHPEDGHEHLILTTTPRSRRVDVEREHLLPVSPKRDRPFREDGRPITAHDPQVLPTSADAGHLLRMAQRRGRRDRAG